MTDFKVKVYRYYGDDTSQYWDGWYFSKVYAINGNMFLVYDDGSSSAYSGKIENYEGNFEWVDFTEIIPAIGSDDKMYKVCLMQE